MENGEQMENEEWKMGMENGEWMIAERESRRGGMRHASGGRCNVDGAERKW